MSFILKSIIYSIVVLFVVICGIILTVDLRRDYKKHGRGKKGERKIKK